jgi:hypothetical protein
MTSLNQLQYLNDRANSLNNTFHEYVDIEVVNNSTSNTPQPIIFSQIKTSNVIDRCQDYYLSIIKWSFNSNIPVLIPQMMLDPTPQTPSLYAQNTEYFINVGYGENTFDAVFLSTTNTRVKYTPENKTLPVPKYMPVSEQDVYNNDFYYIHSVEDFLNMVNSALETSYNAVAALHTPEVNKCPKFYWNPSTNKINIIMSEDFISDFPDVTNHFFIAMNPELYSLFDTFSADCLSLDSSLNTAGNNVLKFFYNYGVNSITIPVDTNLYKYLYIYSQQTSSVVSWSPVNSILFTTTSIPIEPSQSGAPQYLGPLLKNTNATQNLSIVLTDFTIPLTDGTEYSNQMLYYIPNGEYRLVDLLGDQPLQSLTMVVSWKDRLGFIHNCTLKRGANANLKVLLRKKEFNGI